MEIDLEEPSRPQIAALLGISSRWVGELRAKGDLPVEGATWAENLEAWIELKTEGGAGDKLKLDEQRARLVAEQADAKAMDNAERRRELASVSDMTTAVMTVITAAVARLSLVGAAVAKGDAKLRTRIETAIADALEDLSMARVEEEAGGGGNGEDGSEADRD